MNANAQHHSQIDGTIDRALTALRDAAPRSGLENRILASLEHRAASPQPARFHLSAHVALWAATSAAILAVASIIILRHRVVPSPQSAVILSEASRSGAKSKDPDDARPATNPKSFSTTNLAQTTQTASSRPERIARSGETGVLGQLAGRGAETPVFENCADPHIGCPIHDDNVVTNEVSQTPTDAQLLADLHAPSHPAPPLPLTPQEKLFLRMLHYGNATQLAELNPMIRAKHDADETAAFKAFFPDPPPLQQPTGDSE